MSGTRLGRICCRGFPRLVVTLPAEKQWQGRSATFLVLSRVLEGECLWGVGGLVRVSGIHW